MNQKQCKSIWLKRLIILEIVVCYMATLTVVSYLRGPGRYEVIDRTSLLSATDLSSFANEKVAGDSFWMENPSAGAAAGYSARLSLQDLERIRIAYSVECPAEYAGGILYVDLYEPEMEYDNPEQEYSLTLSAGLNQVVFSLNPGISHPVNVNLRFFTLDPAGYEIQNIEIYPEAALPKVSKGLAISVGLYFMLLGVTITAWRMRSRKEVMGQDVERGEKR